MKLDGRKEEILDLIIREYIETASPVSSGRISRAMGRRRIAGSPATVRNIMLSLDEDGFLYQPHTSAGRAPTERGYKYFIENLMEPEDPSSDLRLELDGIFEDFFEETERAFDNLGKALARHLKLFSGVGLLDEERVFGHGLPEVLKEPEFFRHENAVRFADFAENIAGSIRNFRDADADVHGFGVVSVTFRDDEMGDCVIFSAGPQRMDYEKAVSAVKYAADDIKKIKLKKKNGRKR